MSVWKRPEVWGLLVLVAGGAVYIASSGGRGAGPDGAGGDPGGTAGTAGGTAGTAGGTAGAGRLRVESIELTRDYGNARLEIEVDYDNRGGPEVPLSPPDVVLETGGGEPVDPFFLAGDFPDPIAAGQRDRARLKFWLEPGQLGGALVLKVRGEAVQVKPDRPFDLGAVENQKTVRVEAGEWSP
jgi:hypothetical protein